MFLEKKRFLRYNKMNSDLVILGLIFDFLGGLVLIIVNLLGMPYQKEYTAKPKERYYWMEWKIKFNTFPPKLRKQLSQGFIPKKHRWNLTGFLFITIGFLLQIIGSWK